MNLEHKIEKLKNKIIKEAREKADFIINEQNQSIEEIKHAHELKHKNKIKIAIENETTKSFHKDNKLFTSETLKQRKSYNSKLINYSNEIFEEVERKWSDFMKTNEYIDLLSHWIKEAIDFANNDNVCIYINASDKDKKEMLEQKLNVSLSISAYDFGGGTRAVIRSRNVLIDHAFNSLLDNEKKKFHFGKEELHV